MKKTNPKPQKEVVARKLRVQLREKGQAGHAKLDRVVSVVVEEVEKADPS